MSDLTADFRVAAEAAASRQGLSRPEATAAAAARIMRPVKKKTRGDFTAAAQGLGAHIASMRNFIAEARRDYLEPGRVSESERDAIEREVGLFVKASSAQINALDKAITTAQDSPAPPAPQHLAHLRGVVLGLTERLREATLAFDRCRAARHAQLRAKAAAVRPASPAPPSRMSSFDVATETGPSSAALEDAEGLEPAQAQAQAQSEAQRAVLRELLERKAATAAVESGMKEVATLTQMFSTQVLHQADQLEQLYMEAVEATHFMSAGNVQLAKTVEVNKGGRWYMLIILVLASILLLIADYLAG